MKHLLWIVPLRLFFWAIVHGGDTDPDWYDDYYEHDVSGLLEED